MSGGDASLFHFLEGGGEAPRAVGGDCVDATAGEMAGAALYMVSDAASYTTGACILCDGGMLA